MKTRLLKKIRKRYDILFYPDGYSYQGRRYPSIKYELVDKHTAKFFSTYRFHETFEDAYEALIKKIKSTYGNKKQRESIVKKVWYNGNK